MRNILCLLITALILLTFASCSKMSATDHDIEKEAMLTESTENNQPTEEFSDATQPGESEASTPPTAESAIAEETQSIGNTEATTPPSTTCNHTFSPANCTVAKTCSKCGLTDGTANGHSWSSWETQKAAEVGKAGIEVRKCSVCQISDTREIPALLEDSTKAWFVDAYKQAKKQYTNQIDQRIQTKQNKIDELNGKINTLYANYLQQVEQIKAQYPEGASRDSELSRAYTDYSFSLEHYTDQITLLEHEISEIKLELDHLNPDDILLLVSQNCNISYSQASEYYFLYYESLS